jgi:hypothetical protein
VNWLQRLILGDPGPVPSRLPDNLADLPVLTSEHLDGVAAAPAPAEMPSDELMERWKSIASYERRYSGPPVSHRVALLAIAWARQQQAQSLQLPPPGADPVATDGDLLKVLDPILWAHDARRQRWERVRVWAVRHLAGVKP